MPTFCYPKNGACEASDLSFPAPMDVEIFPASTATAPRMTTYTPPTNGRHLRRGAALLDVPYQASLRERETWLTFKATDGSALVRTMWSEGLRADTMSSAVR